MANKYLKFAAVAVTAFIVMGEANRLFEHLFRQHPIARIMARVWMVNCIVAPLQTGQAPDCGKPRTTDSP